MATIKWTKGTIRIYWRDGSTHEVEGLRWGEYAIHKTGVYWQVTHMPSGLTISPRIYIRTMRAAKSLAYAFAAIVPTNASGWGEKPTGHLQDVMLDTYYNWKQLHKEEWVG